MSYNGDLLALSPLAYWKLDETSGTTLSDASGNGRHLTAIGEVEVNRSPLIPAAVGRSILVRAGAYAQPTQWAWAFDPGLNMTGRAFSISLWYKPLSTPGLDTIIIYKMDQPSLRGWGLYHVGAANRIGYSIGDGTGAYAGSNTSMVAGNWYHIVMVIANPAAPTPVAYTNGVLESFAYLTRSPTAILESPRALEIGGWSPTNFMEKPNTTACHGLLDDIQIFETALTAGDVTTLYNRGIAGTESDSLTEFSKYAHWKMDDDPESKFYLDRVGGRHFYKAGKPKRTTGQVGDCVQFNNVSAYALRNSFTGMGLTNFTAVMTVDITDAQRQACALLSYASGSSPQEIEIGLNEKEQKLKTTIRNTVVTSTAPLSTGVNQVVVTWRNSDGRVQMWRNGVLIGSGTAATGVTLTTGGAVCLGMGQAAVASSFFRPSVAGFQDVAMYSSVLTDAQIADLWASFSAPATITPTVLSATSPSLDRVRVFFNTPVTGLATPGNFTAPGLVFTSATPNGDNTYVDLVTTGMTAGNSYTITVGAGVNNGTALADATIDFIGAAVGGTVGIETISDASILRSLLGQPWSSGTGEAPAPTVTVQYLMRAYRSGNNTYVHWLVDNEPDFLAAQAPVSAMLLEDIVVARELCAEP